MSAPPDITIRPARDSDEPGLIALIARCFIDYPNTLLLVDEEMPELRSIQTSYTAWGGQFWVAELKNHLVGSIGWTPVPDTNSIELRKLYVHPDVRRRGLATRLCNLVTNAAREHNADFVELWTDTKFVEAHALYERLGYAADGRTRELHDASDTVEYYYRLEV